MFFLQLVVQHEGKLRQKPEAGNWMSKMKQRRWRNVDYWLVLNGFLSLLSFIPQDHLPSGDITHSSLGLPTSIIRKKILIDMPRGKSDEGNFSTDVPSS